MRVLLAFAVVATSAMACVDGKTPDCSSTESGCFPGDTGSSPPLDAASDASDASSVPDVLID